VVAVVACGGWSQIQAADTVPNNWMRWFYIAACGSSKISTKYLNKHYKWLLQFSLRRFDFAWFPQRRPTWSRYPSHGEISWMYKWYQRWVTGLCVHIFISTYSSFTCFLFGCEIWSLTLREEHILWVFENRMLRGICGPEGKEVVGGWRTLHNEELHNLCVSPDNIRVIKSRRACWTGHVARIRRLDT
jgi:hypothetical protein